MSVRIHGTFGSWVLPAGISVLGRGSTCQVRIDDPRLSRSHANFRVDGSQLEVEDLGSRNGVLVDGVRIAGRAQLHHGQVVVCGPVVLMVAIDQTQPHPRTALGGQDPSTRRVSGKGDTEAMLAAVSPADRPSGSSRGIDPAIQAAISSASHIHAEPARASLMPEPAPTSVTSPLVAVRPAPHGPAPRRTPTTSESLLPPPLEPTGTSALEAATPTSPEPAARLIAGAIDGLRAAVVALAGPLLALAGLALALHLGQVGVAGGLPAFAGAPAGWSELLAALASPAGFARGCELLRLAATGSPVVAVVALATAAISAMAVAAALFIVLVLPTVRRGAPLAHRRRGLAILRTADGLPPGPGQAALRWLLALLLLPLALPAALLRRRAPHDALAGCTVRRVR
jgi:hypothetical protein